MGVGVTVTEAIDDEVIVRLRRKRAEVQAEIKTTEHHLMVLRADFDALNGSLDVFDPKRQGAPRRKPSAPARHEAFKGEMQQIVLFALERAARPITTLDVAKVVMEERALDWNDRALVRSVRTRTLACLQKLREASRVDSKLLAPKLMVWSLIASAPPKG